VPVRDTAVPSTRECADRLLGDRKEDLGIRPAGPIYWYMDRFPDRTSAEAAASAEFLHLERGEAGGAAYALAPGLALVSLGLPTPPTP